jgi:hypothetical protein
LADFRLTRQHPVSHFPAMRIMILEPILFKHNLYVHCTTKRTVAKMFGLNVYITSKESQERQRYCANWLIGNFVLLLCEQNCDL